MIISSAAKVERQQVINLLKMAMLPVQDLPANLEGFLVAEDGGQVIGVAGLEVYKSYGLLRSVAVHTNYRNNHIAAQLLKAVEDGATTKGLTEIYLLTETARQYFEKKGYTVTGRDDVPGAIRQSSEFSHMCPASAIVMRKILPVT